MLEIALEREVADKRQKHCVLNDKNDGRSQGGIRHHHGVSTFEASEKLQPLPLPRMTAHAEIQASLGRYDLDRQRTEQFIMRCECDGLGGACKPWLSPVMAGNTPSLKNNSPAKGTFGDIGSYLVAR